MYESSKNVTFDLRLFCCTHANLLDWRRFITSYKSHEVTCRGCCVHHSSFRISDRRVVPEFCPEGYRVLYTRCPGVISFWSHWLTVNIQRCLGESQVTHPTERGFLKPLTVEVNWRSSQPRADLWLQCNWEN